MQTNPCYFDIKNQNNTKGAIKLQNLLVAFLSFLLRKTVQKMIAKSELLLAGYFAEHHIPFSHADHLLTLCKSAFPDSQIASKLSMKRTKISYVMQNGIAFHEKLKVTNICKESKFSIIIDESTDISVMQILAVVVCYFDSNKHDVQGDSPKC